ncbi:MAG: hypothetical protein KJ906_01110 [Nanoarchaeota archaeon]|nr:hypothetical protein [Nanoarchaeota archaeon]
MKIIVFGDSVAYGAWDLEGGWVQRLRKFLDKKVLDSNYDFFCLLYNCGISGDTTEDLLRRFEFETNIRGAGLIVFEIGINDSVHLLKENKNWVDIKIFENNLKKLIKISQNFTSKIIFVSLTPVDESKVTPIPWDKDKYYTNENIKKYNDIIKNTCKENNIYFIETFDSFMKNDYKKLLEDGLHPNTKGHEMIFNTVKDFLIKNKIISG